MAAELSMAACLIAKDEALHIGRCVSSVRSYVDEVCIYDTGSDDDTVAIVESLADEPGAPVHVVRGDWRGDFAWARAQSFAIASTDWLLWLDADDEVHGGVVLRDLVSAAAASERQTVIALYDSHDAPGGGGWVWRDRVVRRGVGRWEGRVHEFLRVPGHFYERSVVAHPDAFRVRHHRREQRPGRYLDLLRRAAEDPERTPRALHLLGKELMAIATATRSTAPLVEAAAALERYLERGDDRVEGDPNPYRGHTLKWLLGIHETLGRAEDYERVWREADVYFKRLTQARESGRLPDVMFFTELGDFARAWEPTESPPSGLLLEIDPFKGVKAKRNDPCPCGSGRKFKKCHDASA